MGTPARGGSRGGLLITRPILLRSPAARSRMGHPPGRRESPGLSLDAGRRTRRRHPRRRVGRRTRRGRAGRLARRAAADRPQRTTAPRRPIALHRRRRDAADVLRHQHHRHPDRGAGAAPPTARAEDHNPRRPRHRPLHDAAQNQVWLEIALDLPAWMPMLALTGSARLWEPRRLRLRLFCAAAQLVTTGCRRILRLAKHWPWTGVITDALADSKLYRTPADQQHSFPTSSTTTIGSVEPGAHPTRQPGPSPACHQPRRPKRPVSCPDEPSRKVEARRPRLQKLSPSLYPKAWERLIYSLQEIYRRRQ